MQQLCYLISLGNALHIIGSDGAKLYHGDGIDYHGRGDGDAHIKRHGKPSVGRNEPAAQEEHAVSNIVRATPQGVSRR